jgi:coenzyme F420 biosynthesis associated uncharacterized protein
MVDWPLALQIAGFAAGSDQKVDLGVDLVGRTRELESEVISYTGLEPATPVPEAELFSRRQWAAMNLDSLSHLLQPVAGRLDERFEFAGPLAGALRMGAGATLAAEAGLVIGYVSHRVLGQYELGLLQPEVTPRLVFVAPNLERAARDLDVDRDSFFDWIALHELTHVFQFQGVPWLREHFASLVRSYLETVDVRIERGAAGGVPLLPQPAKLVEAFREGGLAALVQTRTQRDIMGKIQAMMSVIEGYSEHVMDALGEEVLPAYAGLRDAMDRRRRSRSAPERVLERLLGLDFKMRQYEVGKRFCDAVAAEGGMDVLNRVWDSAEALPTLVELSRPAAWLERVPGGPAAAVASALTSAFPGLFRTPETRSVTGFEGRFKNRCSVVYTY